MCQKWLCIVPIGRVYRSNQYAVWLTGHFACDRLEQFHGLSPMLCTGNGKSDKTRSYHGTICADQCD